MDEQGEAAFCFGKDTTSTSNELNLSGVEYKAI